MNLVHDLERRAREGGDRVALIYEDGRRFSFAELDERASQLAGAFAKLHVTHGQQVALYLTNGPDLVCCLFALWKIGAVPVTLSALYGSHEINRATSKSESIMVVTDTAGVATVRTASLTIPVAVVGAKQSQVEEVDLDTLAVGCDKKLIAPDMTDDSEAVVLFTGGTTGDPKAVAMTHGGTYQTMARLARAAKGGKPGPYPLVPEDTSPNLIPLPLFHSGGQQTLLFAFHVGRSVLLMEKFSAVTAAKLIAEYRVDNLFLLPTMLYDLAHLPGEPDLSSVRSVLVAGGEVSETLRAEFERRFRIPLLTNYGSTETGHVAGWTRADIVSGGWVPGSVGRVYQGVEVEIKDDEGVPVQRGESGEICVRTRVSSRYVDGGEQALVDESGWVHSGDIGYLDDNDVLFLIGRKRELIKCGGFQVWPMELEEELRQHPSVADLAVIGVPDERLGEVPKAFVVKNHGCGKDFAEPELIEFSRQRLAHYKAVRMVEFVEELPRTDAGKVDRNALRSMSVNG